MSEREQLQLANENFYSFFEDTDLRGMSTLWLNSDECWCTHPGWPTIFGWLQIRASFEQIFSGPEPLQFLTSNIRYHGTSDVAWVYLEENLLGSSLAAVAAVNVFKKESGMWRMVGHQASPLIPDLNLGAD